MTQHLPTTKKEKIVHLLDHWDDIHDPNMSKDNPGNGDSAGPQMPVMAHHRSVLELARCLRILKTEAPSQHDHLMAYHRAEWRIHTWTTLRRRKGGKSERVDHRERQRLKPAWVEPLKVHKGEDRLAELFRGTVYIPDDLWDALTKSSAQIEQERRQGRKRLKVTA
jgi:hypothetical protein